MTHSSGLDLDFQLKVRFWFLSTLSNTTLNARLRYTPVFESLQSLRLATNQTNCVTWSNCLSESYRLKCGVRQGGVVLLCLYVHGFLVELSGTNMWDVSNYSQSIFFFFFRLLIRLFTMVSNHPNSPLLRIVTALITILVPHVYFFFY